MDDKHFGSSVYDTYTLNRNNIKDIIVSIKAIYISGYSFNIRKKQNILMKKKHLLELNVQLLNNKIFYQFFYFALIIIAIFQELIKFMVFDCAVN